jgi:hypothetical protein
MAILSNLYAEPVFKKKPTNIISSTQAENDLKENEHFGFVVMKISIFRPNTRSLSSGTDFFFSLKCFSDEMSSLPFPMW